jgi:hypothetical protein
MTHPHHRLLTFAAEHHAILPAHATALLNNNRAEADQQLAQLTTEGLLEHHRTGGSEPGFYTITRRGLDAIDSPLPEPRVETLRDPQTQLALPWLTLIARAGRFGTYEQILTERVMRHHTHPHPLDHASDRGEPLTDPASRAAQPYGIPLETQDGGRVAWHYPPLLLETPQRFRVAVELQTRHPATPQLTAHLHAYAQHPTIEIALYLVTDDTVAQRIIHLAEQLEVKDAIRVQRACFSPDAPSHTQ